MGKAFLYGNGGGGKNTYEIKAYATEAALLESLPENNTVGVITTIPIGAWQYSTTTPTTRADGTALAEGDIWLNYLAAGNSGSNIVTGANGVFVRPLACTQYLSGVWADKTAMVRLNDTWSGLDYLCYDAGNECIALTGGWTSSSGRTTKNTDNMYINVGGGVESLYTENSIDVTGKTTLKFELSDYAVVSSGSFMFGLGTDPTTVVAYANIGNGQHGGARTMSVDVSSLSGPYKVLVYANVAGGGTIYASAHIKKVYME